MRVRDGVGWGVIWCCLRMGWSGEGVMGENNIIMIGRWHNYLVRDEKQRVRGKKWIAQTAYGIKGRKHRKIERRGVIKDGWYSLEESVASTWGGWQTLLFISPEKRWKSKDEERRASLYDWMEDTRLETDFTLCLTNVPKDYVQFWCHEQRQYTV